MFKPTTAVLSKASRLPLNSKKANRDFYKGTRTGNIMRRKRIATADPQGRQLQDKEGRDRTWTIMTHRIDEARVPSYIVPPGLAQTNLKPYVFNGEARDGGNPRKGKVGLPGYPQLGKNGFDGTYYRSVINEVLSKRKLREEQDKDKFIAESTRKA